MNTGLARGLSSYPLIPLPPRRTVVFASLNIAANASDTVDLPLYYGADCYQLSTDRPARLRFYSTAAHRTADVARLVGTDPTGNHGLMLEVVTTTTMLSLDLAPVAELINLDQPPAPVVYVAVTNLDVSTAVVTTTLLVRQTE